MVRNEPRRRFMKVLSYTCLDCGKKFVFLPTKCTRCKSFNIRDEIENKIEVMTYIDKRRPVSDGILEKPMIANSRGMVGILP